MYNEVVHTCLLLEEYCNYNTPALGEVFISVAETGGSRKELHHFTKPELQNKMFNNFKILPPYPEPYSFCLLEPQLYKNDKALHFRRKDMVLLIYFIE
jgi:hypothetical protein